MSIIFTFIPSFRKLAEKELEVASIKMSTALAQGMVAGGLSSLQQGIDRAQAKIAEIRLLDAINRNATAAEIHLRNETLFFWRALENRPPVSGSLLYYLLIVQSI
jgi:hypothetical protein